MGLFSNILNAIVKVAQSVGKVKVTEIIKNLITFIPSIIVDLGSIKGADAEARIDAACDEIRRFTGIDSTALDLIRDMPADVEDELFNHIADAIGILAKNLAKVPGYHIEGAPDDNIDFTENLNAIAIDKAVGLALVGTPAAKEAAQVVIARTAQPILMPAEKAAGAQGAFELTDTEKQTEELMQHRSDLKNQLNNPSAFTAGDRLNRLSLAVMDLIDIELQAPV